jgi:hypothetical protein
MGTITPIYGLNWPVDPPVTVIGQGYNTAYNSTLDLRSVFSAIVFIQVVNHGRFGDPLPIFDSGMMLRIKRHSMSGPTDIDFYGRCGEIVRYLDPVASATTNLSTSISVGATSLSCVSTEGFTPDTRFPLESNICLYNLYYQNNFEILRVSSIVGNTINLDGYTNYPHHVDGNGADVIHANAMCLDPIELPGGSQWDLNFICDTPSNNVYWIRWFAQLYRADTYTA